MAPKIEMAAIHEFGAELAQELGATVDERYSQHHWAFALIIEPGVRLFAQVENAKARYSLYAFASGNRFHSVGIDCGVSMSRGASVAAHEIRTRLLPEALPVARGALETFKEQDAAAARVEKKAAQLRKRYPNLKIAVSDTRIAICSKYGAGIHLDVYAREESPFGKWPLSSERGRPFGLDDIDSKYGRAFLKLCNDN